MEMTFKESLKKGLILGGLSAIIFTAIYYWLYDLTFLHSLSVSLGFMLGWTTFEVISYFVSKIKNERVRVGIAISAISMLVIAIIVCITMLVREDNKIDYSTTTVIIGTDTLSGTDTIYYDRYTKEEIENLQIINK